MADRGKNRLKGRWAARIDPPDPFLVGDLRLFPGIEALSAADSLWLRGEELGSDLLARMRPIPGLEIYLRDEDSGDR